MGRHALGEVAIGAVVVFFVGKPRCTGDEQELGSIEADAAGAEAGRDRGFFGEFDVRANDDFDAVGRDRRKVARGGPGVFARKPAVVLGAGFDQTRRFGVDDDFAAIAIDDDDRPDPDAASHVP